MNDCTVPRAMPAHLAAAVVNDEMHPVMLLICEAGPDHPDTCTPVGPLRKSADHRGVCDQHLKHCIQLQYETWRQFVSFAFCIVQIIESSISCFLMTSLTSGAAGEIQDNENVQQGEWHHHWEFISIHRGGGIWVRWQVVSCYCCSRYYRHACLSLFAAHSGNSSSFANGKHCWMSPFVGFQNWNVSPGCHGHDFFFFYLLHLLYI